MNEGTDLAVKIVVPVSWAEVTGALLMERLGPYAEETVDPKLVALVFYPKEGDLLSDPELMALLPGEITVSREVTIERLEVPRDWVNGWKDHFHPVTVSHVRVRPPWELPTDDSSLVDVVINPGLGFGTGLHPTTRGTLTLLQEAIELPAGGSSSGASAPATPDAEPTRGALVDAGTGSGILSIAAAKLGWAPIIAFDNDPVALTSARKNMTENGVAGLVEVHECGVGEAPSAWFAGVTVLANMTLTPVQALLRRMAEVRPTRMVASGILAGAQENQVLREAEARGFTLGRSLYEAEWVSMELVPNDGVVS